MNRQIYTALALNPPLPYQKTIFRNLVQITCEEDNDGVLRILKLVEFIAPRVPLIRPPSSITFYRGEIFFGSGAKKGEVILSLFLPPHPLALKGLGKEEETKVSPPLFTSGEAGGS